MGSKKQKNRAMEVLDVKDKLSTKNKQAEKVAPAKKKTKALKVQEEKNGQRKVTETRPGKVGAAKGGTEGRRGRGGGN